VRPGGTRGLGRARRGRGGSPLSLGSPAGIKTPGGTAGPIRRSSGESRHQLPPRGDESRTVTRDRDLGVSLASSAVSALGMSRREMLGERQVAAPLMARRAAHGALRLTHRRFQPGPCVSIELAGLRRSGKPQRASQCQFGHEPLMLVFALFAPAASRPGQHRAMRRQCGRQVAPCGHASTVRQRLVRLVRPDARERRGSWTSGTETQNLRSAILRSRRWRGGIVPRPGGCRRREGWPPPAWSW
jgi:hypothetical protein